ncbi:MAG: hypothetical protein KME60_03205 [Cyanomargarita calcarea GSE-NOS-MK-12-04C]|jgi:acetylornithine/succinyldiaminopimelate/putrescine aminotransferase|uniref:Uncharacterized protein n=1 Tax=Cyanomargarita calcarea GSE-NOS-MK-12-04C TaxID=2839659 RepID=A0A951UQJ5_9CYAN|nr:hypothetical protein [Cyanomargarita calcarea GSE-NOS-MK-12-04C]
MSKKQKTLKQEVSELKEYIMATFPELLRAIQGNGLAIASVLDAVKEESEEIKKALEDAAAGAASPEQLQDAIASLNLQTEQIGKAKDAVQQLIPTVKSPTEPGEPLPTPVPPPDSPGPIVIETAPNTGLPGTVNIDI